MKQKLTIAIDAMGGDNAPEAPVEGAIKASQNDNNEILLVGDPIVLQDELKKVQDLERQGLVSQTESNQIRQAIFKHSPERYLPYKKLLSKFNKNYLWFN